MFAQNVHRTSSNTEDKNQNMLVDISWFIHKQGLNSMNTLNVNLFSLMDKHASKT